MTHEATTPPVTRHTRTASFAGATSGVGPTTWGQTAIRRALAALAPYDDQFNIQWSSRLDEPVPVDLALRVVGDFFWTHESLRTLLRERDGGYEQTVHADGEVAVVEDVVALPSAADGRDAVAEGVAQRLRAELLADPFAYADEWPVRVGLVTAAGSCGTSCSPCRTPRSTGGVCRGSAPTSPRSRKESLRGPGRLPDDAATVGRGRLPGERGRPPT
ncbi:hypothetical protein NKG05_14590 [Oerskovia sp. M15]